MSFLRTLQTSSRYRLDDKIASGGYGEVWRATDVMLGRSVAVKQLPPDRARNEQTLIRFRAEAQRAGSLCHENITRVYDYVEPAPPDPPFLVMELVDGPSAAQVLACGALHPAQAMSIVAETAAGLQAAHEAGLVHRDIKPANLLLTPDGHVKVTDFGISYAINTVPMTSSNTLLGTAGYVAPERLAGGGVAAAGDLYALGIVAWQCLTGRPPFTGTPIEVVIAHRDQPLPSLPTSVPAEVAALIAELTAKDPADRPASAGEVARRAAGLRDRLARESGVSACPLAGPWSGASDGGPSGPLGVSTVPSSEVALIKRAFDRPAPPPAPPEPPAGAEQQPAGPEQQLAGADRPPAGAEPPPVRPGQAPVRPGQARVRRRAGRLRLAVGAAAAAVAVAGVIVAQLTGAGTPGHHPSSPASHRAPGPSTAQQAGGPAGGPAAGHHASGHQASGYHAGTSRPSTPTARVAGGAVVSHATSAGHRPVNTASTAPAVTGGPATTPSANPVPSASPTASAGNGEAKGKGNGNGNGQGNGNGNGQGNGNGKGNG